MLLLVQQLGVSATSNAAAEASAASAGQDAAELRARAHAAGAPLTCICTTRFVVTGSTRMTQLRCQNVFMRVAGMPPHFRSEGWECR